MRAIDAAPLDLLVGIERQKAALLDNLRRHAAGFAAHDALLWGARGTGKSALVRSAVTALGKDAPALVQVAVESLRDLPRLFEELGTIERRFVLLVDDIGFENARDPAARALRSVLEGSIVARPPNIRLAVTANRRAIVAREQAEQDGSLNERDAVDDALALADRFGLVLGFHAMNQEDYLAAVAVAAAHYRLNYEVADALEWAKKRGARSGRVARAFIIEIAGKAGRSV